MQSFKNIRNIHLLRIFVLFLILISSVFLFQVLFTGKIYAQDQENKNDNIGISKFLVCKIEGIIDPTISNYIRNCLKKASEENAALLMIIDTPGGLETSMREITNDIINTVAPVIAFVSPEGARAASAGVFIVYASDIAAMSPSANIGAAHPVNMASQQVQTDEVLMEKIVNDSVSYIRNLAVLHGRNADWAEKAITESVSITSQEALSIRVIDHIAVDVDDLLKQLDDVTINKLDHSYSFSTQDYYSENIEMTFFAKFLHMVTNPNIAYILFIIGLFGIIFEFSQPGLGVSGGIGVLCIILGLYAFSILPVNYAGTGLIVLAIILFILDLKVNLGGLLSIAGIASLLIGSFILIDSEAPYLQIARSLIIGLSLAISAFIIIVVRAVYKVHRTKPVTGVVGLIGNSGKVIDSLDPSGLIKTHGEIWKAISWDNKKIEEGSIIEIVKAEGLLLLVKKIRENNGKK